jgi:hypothetical protein
LKGVVGLAGWLLCVEGTSGLAFCVMSSLCWGTWVELALSRSGVHQSCRVGSVAVAAGVSELVLSKVRSMSVLAGSGGSTMVSCG